MFQSEDGCRLALRNVGVLPQHYTASQSRRHRLETIFVCLLTDIFSRRKKDTEPIHGTYRMFTSKLIDIANIH
jgi:hypothetical protein